MGRHSARDDDDDVDAGTQTGQLAVSDERGDGDPDVGGPRGRHSSVGDDEPAGGAAVATPHDTSDGEPDDGGPHTDGLALIEDALAGPDSGPMPVADDHPRPGPGGDGSPRAVDHDSPTTRIPVVGAHPEPAEERTDVIPTVAGATPDDGDTGEGDTGDVPEVYEVGVDTTGPVVATTAPWTTDHSTTGEPATPAPARPKGRGTAGDLGLIRRHADVRARVIAAVVVPFVVFFAVFVIGGALTARSLIWIWVPAVSAGVLVGLLLDAGHRRYPDAAPAVTEPADPEREPRTR